jgi:hypothetical protein
MEKELKSEDELREKPKAVKIIALVLRIGFVVGLLLMMGWFALRGCYQQGTAAMKKYLFTQEAAELYEAGELEILRLGEYNDSSLERVFYIGNIYYTESLGQFQFMIRYNKNNEQISSVVEKNGLHCFSFALADDQGNVYTEYEYTTDGELMYGYYRLIFSGVYITDALRLKVYVFLDDGKEKRQSDALDSCVVWYTEGIKDDYALSKAERNGEKPTEGLLKGSVIPADGFADEEEEN